MPKITKDTILKSIRLAAMIVLIPAAIIAIAALLQPTAWISETVPNSIRQDTSVSYTATIKPGILYPNGATVTPSGPLITKITDRIFFDIQSRMVSSRPVRVNGSGRASVRVSADNLWERNFVIADTIPFDSTAVETDLYSSHFSVDMADIAKQIQKIEEQTGIIKTEYKVKVILDLTGQIQADGRTITLEPVPEVEFLYNGSTLELAGGSDESAPVETKAAGVLLQAVKDYSITSQVTTPNTLFGTAIPITVARLISIPITLLLAGFLAFRPVARLVMARSGMSPAARINRKYKSRLITVMERPNTKGKAVVEFRAFPELVRVADQKELPILCHDGGDGAVLYFLIDPTAVYSHTADNTPAAVRQGTLLFRLAGKGGTTDAG